MTSIMGFSTSTKMKLFTNFDAINKQTEKVLRINLILKLAGQVFIMTMLIVVICSMSFLLKKILAIFWQNVKYHCNNHQIGKCQISSYLFYMNPRFMHLRNNEIQEV